MNQSLHRPFSGSAQWLGFFGLLCLMLVRPALATDAMWPPADQVGAIFNFTVPGNPPPVIDATLFDNQNKFTINFEAVTANPETFETWNTIFYTNNGLMVANAPLSTNGIVLTISPGCGFVFDQQSTSTGFHTQAGTFYSAGDIQVNSVLNNDETFFSLATVGKFSVLATNIVDPGTVTVGENGSLKFTGQTLDLSRGQYTIENLNTLINLFESQFNVIFLLPLNLNVLVANVGTETNFIDPAVQFSLPNPTSDSFIPPLFMSLQNATAYVNDTGVVGSSRSVRAVFISNPVPSVTNNVYFNTGFGDILVQWAGSYLNPATGAISTNLMYLEDDFGEITNLQVALGGGPVNYSWLAEWPFPLGPASPTGLPPFTFDNILITNAFAYESVQLIATTVATNASTANPSGALSNSLGSVWINASRDLDLSKTQIGGPNYMSIMATNNFEGSVGASIFSPFSDISLGVTNGYLSVSNLLAPSVPNWNGPIQAFSVRWSLIDAFGVTNNFHVLMINSLAVATTTPVVQDLVLHGTNLYVSDVFNIIRKLSVDATSMTLTTNLETGGFGAQDGELNWYGSGPLNANQFPNLRWLTNNGAIRAANIAGFGTPSTVYGAFINSGLVGDQGISIWATNFFNGGAMTNGSGSFVLQALTATMSNSLVSAGSDLTINSSSLVLSNADLLAGRMLQLTATNLLTDFGATNSFWSAGTLGISGSDSGFNLPIKPLAGDLLGTTVTNIAPAIRSINNTWSAQDRGYVAGGYLNNVALGQYVLDVKGPTAKLNFTGTGTNYTTNAIYVDCLQLHHYASYTNRVGTTLPVLAFNTNLVIYYAQALIDDGSSVAEKINHFNGDHLRWVPAYAGIFSGTNLIYPDGTTNFVNAALAASGDIDSDGDGIPNNSDPSPILTPSQLGFQITMTNLPPKSVKIQWNTSANATNYIYYKTNLLSPNWLPFTNFQNYYYGSGSSGANTLHTNWFPSPFGYPSAPAPVWIFDTATNGPRFYQIVVQPWLTYPN
jgi:hypothetical protein